MALDPTTTVLADWKPNKPFSHLLPRWWFHPFLLLCADFDGDEMLLTVAANNEEIPDMNTHFADFSIDTFLLTIYDWPTVAGWFGLRVKDGCDQSRAFMQSDIVKLDLCQMRTRALTNLATGQWSSSRVCVPLSRRYY